MSKSLCILQANCQGDALKILLEQTPSFNKYFSIAQYYNYKKTVIPDDAITKCSIFLHQYLGPEWQDNYSVRLRQRLSGNCQAIQIPNMFFKGYWPNWTNKSDDIDFADDLLENMISMGLSPGEILHLYLKADEALLGNTIEIAEDSLKIEEEKESSSLIKCSHIIRERWQKEQLFITVNHPGNVLFFHVAERVLDLLGLGRLPGSVRNGFRNPQDDFWLPIHPALASLSHLPFAKKDRKYRIFCSLLTHAQYISCYLACRQQKVKNLLSFLNNMSPNNGWSPEYIIS